MWVCMLLDHKQYVYTKLTYQLMLKIQWLYSHSVPNNITYCEADYLILLLYCLWRQTASAYPSISALVNLMYLVFMVHFHDICGSLGEGLCYL